MSLTENTAELFEGFSKLSRDERYQRLLAMGALTSDDVEFLRDGGVKNTELADKLIENVLGYFQLPLGVATNFRIDGEDYAIPMVVEETSVVAALSKTAKWIRDNGSITTSVTGECTVGQIQLPHVRDVEQFVLLINESKAWLIEQANLDVAASMVQRGGGVMDLDVRQLPRPDNNGMMVVIHVFMNSCDAMGANILNQVLEYLKGPIETLTGETVGICILSNLNDSRLTTATVKLYDIDPSLGQRLQEASLFAETDPYRAATHNKGAMNGVDAVLIATGNDWRAVEAGVHAYAARQGRYSAITRWRYQDSVLTGVLTAPIIVGTVGGVTSLHPTAKLCLRMLGVTSASQLSRIIAAVGLVQNLGAMRALCTDGIIQGHMKLHLDNLVLVSGATDAETPLLKARLQQWLATHKRVSLNHAYQLLTEMRKTRVTS